MANYVGVTVSEGGKINNTEKVKEIVNGWRQVGSEGELTVTVENDIISIWGYDDFYIYTGDEDNYDDMSEECLKELCPYIGDEPLIIKSVGYEKCRYIGAGAWIVTNDGVRYASLDEAIDYKLNNK